MKNVQHNKVYANPQKILKKNNIPLKSAIHLRLKEAREFLHNNVK